MAKTLNSALSSIYDRFVFTGSTRSEFYYTGGIGGDDTQVTALQLTTLKNVDDETVLTTDASQDVSLANDLKLLSDASVLNFGTNNDVKLTHVHNTGLLLTQDGSGSIPVLQIRDSALTISSSADGQLDIAADTVLAMDAPTIQFIGSTLSLGENTASDITINLLGTNNDMAIVYDESAKKLAFDTDVLVVDGSADRVGIGTASPSEVLEVASQNASCHIALTAETSGDYNSSILFADNSAIKGIVGWDDGQSALKLVTGTSNNGVTGISILASGNVGIGTATPEKLLHVSANVDGTTYPIMIDNRDTTAGSRAGLLFSAHDQEASIEVERGATNQGVDMRFLLAQPLSSTKKERLTILESGNVGIGTATPDSEDANATVLHIAQTDNTNQAVLNFTGGTGGDSSGIGQIQWSDPGNTDERVALIEGSVQGTNATPGGSLGFYTQPDGGEVALGMFIDEDQNVGIRMVPNTAFNVKGAADSGIRLYKSDGSTLIGRLEGDGDQDGFLQLNSNNETTDILFHGQNGAYSYMLTGNFGIGTATPGSKLEAYNGGVMSTYTGAYIGINSEAGANMGGDATPISKTGVSWFQDIVTLGSGAASTGIFEIYIKPIANAGYAGACVILKGFRTASFFHQIFQLKIDNGTMTQPYTRGDGDILDGGGTGTNTFVVTNHDVTNGDTSTITTGEVGKWLFSIDNATQDAVYAFTIEIHTFSGNGNCSFSYKNL